MHCGSTLLNALTNHTATQLSQCYKLAILTRKLVLTSDYWKQLKFASFKKPKAGLCLKNHPRPKKGHQRQEL